jgi:YHS domain-containing protein
VNAGKKPADDSDDPKEALQALQEFIGNWKGSANDIKNKGFWTESSSWSWRFKGKDVWMSFEMENSKLYKGGELRFLPDKSKYQLTITDKAGKKSTYEGVLKNSQLIVERKNPDTADTEQLKINNAGGGDRLVYALWIKPANRTQYSKQLEVGYTKEGVTFGVESGGKKPECVVTGGLGTSTVSYKGVTYYVCCSGCRDAFNENPEKIIVEYLKKKKKSK